MSFSYVEWAFNFFSNQNFLLCGKTVGSLRRNILSWLIPLLRDNDYEVHEKRTENKIIIIRDGSINWFYYFGGKDESSQDLVQGITAAGALFDEVALMPQSFVNQVTGRCSVEGAKLWFNCNPDSPSHWFKREWIDKAADKRLLHIHFTMDDNPSLSEATKNRYKTLYSGIFYQRFIRGLWVVAEGAIYDMWTDENVYDDPPVVQGVLDAGTRDIAIDYGTQNATVFLEILDVGSMVLVQREYYHSGRNTGMQKTDSQYADDLDKFSGGSDQVRFVIIDPSAASFRAELRQRGYRIKEADNEVLDGIRLTATLIARRIVRVHRSCENLIREIGSYVWDPKPTERGKEQPVKKDDHGCDALRYWVKTIFRPRRLLE